jgi:hypothetical protein
MRLLGQSGALPLAVAILVAASVYLRQRGSAESKPVVAGDHSTGS